MGNVIKRIVGDHSQDPDFEEFIIEDNSDGNVHIHMGYLRLDMRREDYNIFYDHMVKAYGILKERYNWSD
jgi:hypothetical protein